MNKPIIGITMGDAAGIGPEIIVKALSDATLYESCRPLVIGDAKMLERAGPIIGVQARIEPVAGPDDAGFQPGTIDCIDLDLLPSNLPFGTISAEAGHAAFAYLEKAVQLAQDKKIDAVCTAPLNKEALHAGGHHYPGHTEILAEMTGTSDFAMMFHAPKLRVILVTIHLGLMEAIETLDADLVFRTISLAHQALISTGIANPRIGVCGINPHAGEGGLFGRGEEEEKIVPAVQRAGEQGMNVEGPLPADTLFYRVTRGDFDIVVAMYHDQGLGPVKVLGLEDAVNITLGLPIIRTSVDHGTAFDIAGKGTADARNMRVAIEHAVRLVENKT